MSIKAKSYFIFVFIFSYLLVICLYSNVYIDDIPYFRPIFFTLGSLCDLFFALIALLHAKAYKDKGIWAVGVGYLVSTVVLIVFVFYFDLVNDNVQLKDGKFLHFLFLWLTWELLLPVVVLVLVYMKHTPFSFNYIFVYGFTALIASIIFAVIIEKLAIKYAFEMEVSTWAVSLSCAIIKMFILVLLIRRIKFTNHFTLIFIFWVLMSIMEHSLGLSFLPKQTLGWYGPKLLEGAFKIGMIWVSLYYLGSDYKKLREQNEINIANSLTDSLTNLKNRRFFDNEMKQMLDKWQKEKINYAVMIIDIDNFKKYNDTYGHFSGDKCLVIVANTLSMIIRNNKDFIARTGGEEFCVIVHDISYSKLTTVCERMRKAVISKKIAHEKNVEGDGYVSISIGAVHVCCYERVFITNQSILEKADQCLYNAKKEGRNRAVIELINLEGVMDIEMIKR